MYKLPNVDEETLYSNFDNLIKYSVNSSTGTSFVFSKIIADNCPINKDNEIPVSINSFLINLYLYSILDSLFINFSMSLVP